MALILTLRLVEANIRMNLLEHLMGSANRKRCTQLQHQNVQSQMLIWTQLLKLAYLIMCGFSYTTTLPANTLVETLTILLTHGTNGLQVKLNKCFWGVPASQAAAGSGFIPSDVLISQVLPAIMSSPKYGGVMLWDRFNDLQNKYSDAIKGNV
ncbi:Glycoside hydrolase superfamily [Sesbania bispinosa]|nr:Glycoside hydrolase superfamily [Sesbania bispinosa]